VEQGGIELIQVEELWADFGADDHGGWFCVRTNPFPCPANGCDFVAEFMTAAHLILVWEQRDDPNLLHHAQRAKAKHPYGDGADTIGVVIAPDRSPLIPERGKTGLLRYIGEGPIAVVSVERILERSVALRVSSSNIEVEEAIVVVIAPRDTLAGFNLPQSGPHGFVNKRAIAHVPVQCL